MILLNPLVCLCLGLLPIVLSAPQGSLVVSSTEPSQKTTNEVTTPEVPRITSMNIETNVTNRFAKTLITSRVKNVANQASEAVFSVVLPQQAFISGFVMEIDGKNYTAYVAEKEEAKKTYDNAVKQGLSAAHVSASARDSNKFTVNVNLEPESKAIFYLTYEELLQRQKGQYEIVLNIHPGQPVKQMDIKVLINETRPVSFVRSPSLRSGNEIAKTHDDKLNPHPEIETLDEHTSLVKFSPDVAKQKQFAKELGTEEDGGFAGQFVVQYDVERDPLGGEVLLDDGFFVHFFAPTDRAPLPKYITFVLDTSGSMWGQRIKQLQEAMDSILSELKPTDVFNIIEFNSLVKVWDVASAKVGFQEGEEYIYGDQKSTKPEVNVLPKAFQANADNIEKAKEIVGKFNADGGTDIDTSLRTAMELVQKNKNTVNQPMIVFLTDGEATVGETSNERIVANITATNEKQIPIFSLSFGDGADKAFLEEISLKNLGFSRHIYEGADAALQLQDFYKQISSPLLSNVHFKYVSNVTEVTQVDFPILFDGSEIVVAGKKIDDTPEDFLVICPEITLKPRIQKPVTSLERLWAYLTVKQILSQRDIAENKTELTAKALAIALKYSFVTDVTSLVVVKPNATDAVDAQEASGNRDIPDSYLLKSSGPYYSSPAAFSGPIPIRVSDPQSWNYALEEAEPLDFAVDRIYNPAPATELTELSTTSTYWLDTLLSDNGTFEYNNNSYIVRPQDLTLTSSQECPKSPTNTTGICKLIFDCPEVRDIVADVETFLQYSCKIHDVTGICCPSQNSTTVQP